MTYKKLYEDALFKLEHNKITLGEFEKMIKPLEREVEQEPILDKIRAEIIEKYWDCDICRWKDFHFNLIGDISDILKIIDKYKAETEET